MYIAYFSLTLNILSYQMLHHSFYGSNLANCPGQLTFSRLESCLYTLDLSKCCNRNSLSEMDFFANAHLLSRRDSHIRPWQPPLAFYLSIKLCFLILLLRLLRISVDSQRWGVRSDMQRCPAVESHPGSRVKDTIHGTPVLLTELLPRPNFFDAQTDIWSQLRHAVKQRRESRTQLLISAVAVSLLCCGFPFYCDGVASACCWLCAVTRFLSEALLHPATILLIYCCRDGGH